MSTPLQVKMFKLAGADATLQGYLLGANNTLRWFPVQLPKGYIYQGACVVVRQISSAPMFAQAGMIGLEPVMMQLDCYDLDSLTAQALAAYLTNIWFPSVSFASDAQFLSPPQTPPNFPNYKLSQRSSLDYQVQPQPAWVETLTMRIWNNVAT